MPGASSDTQRVDVLNANWRAGADRADGAFELMLVTEDGARHTVAPSPATVTALIALSRAGAVLLWDPTDRVLIAANVVGDWLPQDWSAQPRR